MKHNYFEVRSAIASRILNHPTLGATINEYRKKELELIVQDPTWNASTWNMVRCQFEQYETSMSIDIDNESNFRDDYLTDEDGNQYQKMVLRVQLNHPGHGATDAKTQLDRVCFYERVAQFAVELQEEFKEPVTKIVYTAKELVQKEHAKKVNEVNARIKALLAETSKSMRVGGKKFVMAEGIPEGSYANCCHGGKSFHLEVPKPFANDTCKAQLTRVT